MYKLVGSLKDNELIARSASFFLDQAGFQTEV